MSTTTYQIKCAKCNVPLEGSGSDPQPNDYVSCPSCGESDTFENVMGEVKEYIAQKAVESLSNGIKDTFSSRDFVKVTVRDEPHRNYRFIIDYEPEA